MAQIFINLLVVKDLKDHIINLLVILATPPTPQCNLGTTKDYQYKTSSFQCYIDQK